MDILQDPNRKSYAYTSRYASFNYYYNTKDNKFIYGLTNQLDENTPYVLIDIDQYTTLDFLANKYYGRPDYYWVIADFNRIKDCFKQLYPKYKQIKIPSIASITYEGN